jgi:hypothetical protein
MGATMRTAIIGVLGAFLALSSSGCGTVCNLAGGIAHPDSEPRVYGGVIKDLEVLDEAISNPPTQPLLGESTGGDARLALVVLALLAADPILSFVADTLTLPITVPLQERRIAAGKRQSERGPKATSAGPVAGDVAPGSARTLDPPREGPGATAEPVKPTQSESAGSR